MKEQFVSYEIAKILKEKDFNEPCIAAYLDTSYKLEIIGQSDFFNIAVPSGVIFNENITKNTIAVPLYQQVIYWFVKEHDIEIKIERHLNYPNQGWIGRLNYYKKDGIGVYHLFNIDVYPRWDRGVYECGTYMECINECIKEAIKILK